MVNFCLPGGKRVVDLALGKDGLEANLVQHPDGQGVKKYVLCRSTDQAEKERAMLSRQSEGLTAELFKIHA